MSQIPTLWKLLFGLFFTCPLACVFAWFVLLANICSNPLQANAATRNTIPYNCHGATVFITPLEQGLLDWLVPGGMVFVVLVNGIIVVIIIASVIRKHEAYARALDADEMNSSHVRIIATPPGEAPQWVREKWVGLELPLAQWSTAPNIGHTAGVLSGPCGFLGILVRLLRGEFQSQRGFRVNVLKAVAVLERASPEAAQWWRTSAPHLMKPSRCFLFPEDVCKVVR